MRFCLFAQRRAWFINLGCGRESERDWEREKESERVMFVVEREIARERRHVVFKSCFNVAKVFPSQRMNPGNRCDLSKKSEKREKFWSELERILIHLAKKTTNDVLAKNQPSSTFLKKSKTCRHHEAAKQSFSITEVETKSSPAGTDPTKYLQAGLVLG